MSRLSMFCGLGILSLALLVGAGNTQDAKKETKVKGMLPPGFKDLGLSKAQVLAIYTVQTDYRGKINDLENKIKEMKKTESVEVFKVLTEPQRQQYLKSKGLEPKEKAPPKDKK
jgi:hypothetical protein